MSQPKTMLWVVIAGTLTGLASGLVMIFGSQTLSFIGVSMISAFFIITVSFIVFFLLKDRIYTFSFLVSSLIGIVVGIVLGLFSLLPYIDK